MLPPASLPSAQARPQLPLGRPLAEEANALLVKEKYVPQYIGLKCSLSIVCKKCPVVLIFVFHFNCTDNVFIKFSHKNGTKNFTSSFLAVFQ
jgi:hypothetical protein